MALTRLSKQEKLEIIELCKTGNYSYRELYEKYGRPRRTIWRLLKKNDMSIGKTEIGIKVKLKYSEDFVNELMSLYKTGECNCYELSKKFNIAKSTISYLFKRYNFKIKSHSEISRKYPIKEDFFDIIDTQEKAYFLGWLYSDGYNNIKNNKVTIQLQEKDKEILEKLNNLIQPTKPLFYQDMTYMRGKTGYPNTKSSYRLTIQNKHISEKLVELGCGQAKTFTLTFPEWLDKDLIRHFIRGVVDGDGYISKNVKRPEVSLVSTLSFCHSVKDIVSNVLSINSYLYTRHPERNNNIRDLKIQGGRQVRRFLDWIYKDSTIHLQRKYERYLILKEKQQQILVTH